MTKPVIYPIVKPVLPNIACYNRYIEQIFERNWLTNAGPMVQALEQKLAEYLGVEHLLLVANGTLALEVAYAALGITGKVITTPFTFAASASSLCWQGIKPQFTDIHPTSLNFCPTQLPSKLDSDVSALLAVHVFGNPCEVELLEQYTKQHNIAMIYDAAHAFGSQFKNRSLLSYGDAATLSLHATKLFHSIEGGAIVFKTAEHKAKAKQIINFGFDTNNIPSLVGINAKMSEMHAAMGLCLFDMADDIISHRQALVAAYQQQLHNIVLFQQWHNEGKNNGAYMPVLFESEQQLLQVMQALAKQGTQTRRYFYPSLANIGIYANQQAMPVTDNIAARILCLPMYYDLTIADVSVICQQIKSALL